LVVGPELLEATLRIEMTIEGLESKVRELEAWRERQRP
jgi:hypothetical protein